MLNILIQANSDVEPGCTRFCQEFWFAMFTYAGYNEKLNLWRKLGVAWNYIRTGKMHEDQMILHPEEAKKLADFINSNIIEGEK